MHRLACLIAAAIVLVPAAAAAQAAEAAVGVAALRDANNDILLPVGWVADGSFALTDRIEAVVDVSASYRHMDLVGAQARLSVYGAMAGARAAATVARFIEFVQLAAGFVRSSGTVFDVTDTHYAFALQPGVGVDYPLNRTLRVRAQFDARLIRNGSGGNEGRRQYRFAFGLVYRR